MLRIALAALKPARSVGNGLDRMRQVLADCAARQVEIVCFPEAYLPGLRGGSEEQPPVDPPALQAALGEIRARCRELRIAAIAGMEWVSPLGLENRAFVIGPDGSVLGYQTKNQITPGGEERYYVSDGRRQVFRLGDAVFGIVICHEGWRYPETVRWAAVRGAQIVFQPQWTGSDRRGQALQRWGESFYEKAMQCRAAENTIFFASVNHALRFQNSATSLIGPGGDLLAHVPYGVEDVLVADVDLAQATRRYALRYSPALYPD